MFYVLIPVYNACAGKIKSIEYKIQNKKPMTQVARLAMMPDYELRNARDVTPDV